MFIESAVSLYGLNLRSFVLCGFYTECVHSFCHENKKRNCILNIMPFVNFTDATAKCQFSSGENDGISIILATTYDSTTLDNFDVEGSWESSIFRDSLRLYKFWGDDTSGVSVSIVEATVTESSRHLRSDFASRRFLRALDAHVSSYNLDPLIKEIILDYMWMPDSWALSKYGSHKFGLLNNLVKLAKRIYPLSHIKAGGVVYLPTPWQFYHGIVMSKYWKELKYLYWVEYIEHVDAQSNPLVRSDMIIKESIGLCGKSVVNNLASLTSKGEKFESLSTEDLQQWRGKNDIFMKLTRK